MAINKNTVDSPLLCIHFHHSPWVELLALELSNIAPQKILCIAVLHKASRVLASKHETQPIRLNPNPELPLWMILHPSLYTPAKWHSRPCPIVPLLDCSSLSTFQKLQLRNRLPLKLSWWPLRQLLRFLLCAPMTLWADLHYITHHILL